MRNIIPLDRLNENEILRINTILNKIQTFGRGAAVLDCGCGDGRISIEKAMDGCDVWGIDNHPGQLAAAKEYAQQWSTPGMLQFTRMDATSLLFPDAYFDLVIVSEVLEHMQPDEMIRAVREIKRVTKPDATILVTVPWNDTIKGSKEFPHHIVFNDTTNPLSRYFNIIENFNVPIGAGRGWVGCIARNRPKVSVLIPLYNNSRYIRDAIASVYSQDGFFDYEILVSDDASTEPSVNELYAFPDVKLIMHESNAGAARGWKELFKFARGDAAIILSSDDMLLPDTLQKMYARLTADKHTIMVYGYILPLFEDGHIEKPFVSKPFDYQELIESNYIGGAVMVRTSLRDAYLPTGEAALDIDLNEGGACDWGLWLRIAEYAKRENKSIVRLEEPCYVYRTHKKATRYQPERQQRVRDWRDTVQANVRLRRGMS